MRKIHKYHSEKVELHNFTHFGGSFGNTLISLSILWHPERKTQLLHYILIRRVLLVAFAAYYTVTMKSFMLHYGNTEKRAIQCHNFGNFFSPELKK